MKTVNLNNLFDAARRETAPAVDVADSVLAMLAVGRRSAASVFNRSLLWVSMASSAVAASVVLAALIIQQHHTDAVNELLNVVAWVAQ